MPKTVVYKRVGLEKNDFKATFTIIYPRIKILGSKSVEQKIIKSLNYEKVFDYSLDDEIKKFSSLENVYYKLNYNKNGFWTLHYLWKRSARILGRPKSISFLILKPASK